MTPGTTPATTLSVRHDLSVELYVSARCCYYPERGASRGMPKVHTQTNLCLFRHALSGNSYRVTALFGGRNPEPADSAVVAMTHTGSAGACCPVFMRRSHNAR